MFSLSNEDIENSNADMARDLRILVRKMLSEGKTKDEIISYIHDMVTLCYLILL